MKAAFSFLLVAITIMAASEALAGPKRKEPAGRNPAASQNINGRAVIVSVPIIFDQAECAKNIQPMDMNEHRSEAGESLRLYICPTKVEVPDFASPIELISKNRPGMPKQRSQFEVYSLSCTSIMAYLPFNETNKSKLAKQMSTAFESVPKENRYCTYLTLEQ